MKVFALANRKGYTFAFSFVVLGGGKGSMFYSKRYAASSGLNSTNLDFLPVQNIEEIDMTIGGLGAVPVGTLLFCFFSF